MIKSAYYKMKIGLIKISYDKEKIEKIEIVESIDGDNQKTVLTDMVAREIETYLEGKLINFSFIDQLSPQGTAFQKEVWQALLAIPYGQTRTYSQIAHSIGRAKSTRAVSTAIGKNPIAIVIPCHRVIGKDGSLRGYAYGLDIKRKLLAIENQYSPQNLY